MPLNVVTEVPCNRLPWFTRGYVTVMLQANAKNLMTGASTEPDVPTTRHAAGSASTTIIPARSEAASTSDAAALLVAHLFQASDRDIPGVSYAVAYQLAARHSGGDIVDVYQFDNDTVALSIADISGKGTQAAIHAALIKYGLRAYASHGLTPEKTMRAMDRLYLENSTFEQNESFASVFLATVDPERRVLTYASAGHEPVFIVQPQGGVEILKPTAPLIGVFDDQHHLFHQGNVRLERGTMLVATTDGLTDARNQDGEFYGMRRLLAAVEKHQKAAPNNVVEAILGEAGAFCGGSWQDDVAILVARFGS